MTNSRQFCNIYNKSPPVINTSTSIVQIWLLVLHPNIEKLKLECSRYGYYPYCIGKVKEECYIIYRESKLKYNPIDKFLKYYDKSYLYKNLLILNTSLIETFKRYLHLTKEVSGYLKYEPLLVNDKFSWKYIDKSYDVGVEGDFDSAKVTIDKITYHSHPLNTYILKNVKVAWPSMEDYLSVNHIYRTKNITKEDPIGVIYHLVISKEGIYIIICKGQVSENLIKDKLNISYKLENIDKFIEICNKVSDKIKTVFYPWINITSGIFVI